MNTLGIRAQKQRLTCLDLWKRLALKTKTVLILFGCFFTISAVTTGCNRTQQDLIGTWRVDLESIRRDPEGLKIAPPAGTMARAWKVKMMRSWRFTFNSNRSLVMSFQGGSYKGRYEISNQVGNTLYINAEVKELPLNEFDKLMGLKELRRDVRYHTFRVEFERRVATLVLKGFDPIKLKKERLIDQGNG